MKTFLLIISIATLILNARFMKEDYDKENLVGVVYWGFWTLIVTLILI